MRSVGRVMKVKYEGNRSRWRLHGTCTEYIQSINAKTKASHPYDGTSPNQWHVYLRMADEWMSGLNLNRCLRGIGSKRRNITERGETLTLHRYRGLCPHRPPGEVWVQKVQIHVSFDTCSTSWRKFLGGGGRSWRRSPLCERLRVVDKPRFITD